MAFAQTLVERRKQKGLTQRQLAKKVGIHVIQISRYENGTSQPTLEVLRKMAIALHVSADALVFDAHERDPDDDLRLQFEAVSQFEPADKKVVKALLDGMILKHEAKRWSSP